MLLPAPRLLVRLHEWLLHSRRAAGCPRHWPHQLCRDGAWAGTDTSHHLKWGEHPPVSSPLARWTRAGTSTKRLRACPSSGMETRVRGRRRATFGDGGGGRETEDDWREGGYGFGDGGMAASRMRESLRTQVASSPYAYATTFMYRLWQCHERQAASPWLRTGRVCR